MYNRLYLYCKYEVPSSSLELWWSFVSNGYFCKRLSNSKENDEKRNLR